jgi:hypothetical protein
MSHVISVRPEGVAWVVEGAPTQDKLKFPSGGAAEVAAKAIAERLTQQGRPAEIRIHLRDGRLGAKFYCPTRELEWA